MGSMMDLIKDEAQRGCGWRRRELGNIGALGPISEPCICCECGRGFIVSSRDKPFFSQRLVCPECRHEHEILNRARLHQLPKPYTIDGTLTDFPR